MLQYHTIYWIQRKQRRKHSIYRQSLAQYPKQCHSQMETFFTFHVLCHQWIKRERDTLCVYCISNWLLSIRSDKSTWRRSKKPNQLNFVFPTLSIPQKKKEETKGNQNVWWGPKHSFISALRCCKVYIFQLPAHHHFHWLK